MTIKTSNTLLYNAFIYFSIVMIAIVLVNYIFPDIKASLMSMNTNLKEYLPNKTNKTNKIKGLNGEKQKPILLLDAASNVQCENSCPDPTYRTLLHEIYDSYSQQRNTNKVSRKASKGSSPVGPANIFIIRHGERDALLVGLDCNGMRRSCKFVDIVNKLNVMNYSIDYIVTCNPDINNGSMHMEQTVMVSAWLLDIPLFIFGSDKQTDLAIQQIYSQKIFNNKNVLICWEHTCIQTLLNSILTIGPSVKKIPNKAFLNKTGQLSLPYWDTNNYQSMIQLNEQFEDIIYDTGIHTCQKTNNHLKFGVNQICRDGNV
jgi:hypothetical protein